MKPCAHHSILDVSTLTAMPLQHVLAAVCQILCQTLISPLGWAWGPMPQEFPNLFHSERSHRARRRAAVPQHKGNVPKALYVRTSGTKTSDVSTKMTKSWVMAQSCMSVGRGVRTGKSRVTFPAASTTVYLTKGALSTL